MTVKRSVIWRIEKSRELNNGHLSLGTYAEILELERKIKILSD